jgi:hypothetical protein
MKKKGCLFVLLCIWLIRVPFVFPISKADFDNIIDFSITLDVLSQALESGNYSSINKNKLLLINGIISVIRPGKTDVFYMTPEDILNPSNFIVTLKNGKDTISRFLFESFSDQLKRAIKTYSGSSDERIGLIGAITDELNAIIKKIPIYEPSQPSRFKSLSAGKDLVALAGSSLSTEERAFVNRLLLEVAYPTFIKKFEIEVEILYGAWIGYDEVRSYKSIISFRGIECFKLFKRKSTRNASRDTIDVNATVLIVAKVIEPITLVSGERAWYLEGLYIREIK